MTYDDVKDSIRQHELSQKSVIEVIVLSAKKSAGKIYSDMIIQTTEDASREKKEYYEEDLFVKI